LLRLRDAGMGIEEVIVALLRSDMPCLIYFWLLELGTGSYCKVGRQSRDAVASCRVARVARYTVPRPAPEDSLQDRIK
jgi:hypothetical protein